MGHAGSVLDGLKDSSLPHRAVPVIYDLDVLIERGREKCSKYQSRSGIEGMLSAKSEAVCFPSFRYVTDAHLFTAVK